MPDFLVREANNEDGRALVATLARAWGAYEGCRFETGEEVLIRPASHFSERGGRLWLLLRDGEVAGSLGVSRAARADEFELSLVCLDRALRGQGLAAALLFGAEAFAAASGGTRLNIWVDQRLVDGVRFLERQGFVRDPGVRRRDDGSEALDAHYSRQVSDEVSSRPSEDRPADAG